MKVLVTDGENRSSLAVTRSLGRMGCKVVVTGKDKRNIAALSKYCWKTYQVPDPRHRKTVYVDAIQAIANREGVEVIFPTTDMSIHLLNPIRQMLFPAILACPNNGKVETVSDKVSVFQLAGKLNVPIPNTLYLISAEDLDGLIEKITHYPVVVKPSKSRTPEGNGFLPGGVRYAASEQELIHLYATHRVLQYPSMIQEMVIGPGTGLFTLYDLDRHIALFSHRRIREKPPSGGISVVSESVPLDEEMVNNAGRLLSSVGWQGVAMVEFKRDLRDGKAKLMEINGRFWGTLQLAIACGVDFPSLYLDYLQGKQFPENIRDYRIGLKLKWFFGTLDHLLIRLKNRDKKLNLPPGSPSKWEAFKDFLKIWERNATFDVFDRNDVGPFWFEAQSYVWHLLKRS